MRRLQLLCFAVMLLLASTAATADSITPISHTEYAPIDTEWTFDLAKTVTISDSSAMLDVFFLFDATSSMTGLLTQAVTNAQSIVDQLALVYNGSTSSSDWGDLAIGVGFYQDFVGGPTPAPYFGSPGDVPFGLLSGHTTDLDAAVAALGAIPTTGGGGASDLAESQFYALTQAAGLGTWRPGAEKVVVWFGDSPGWDHDHGGYYPSTLNITDVISALSDAGIIVEAIDLGSDLIGLDTDVTTMGKYIPGGQATSITTGTGGDLMTGLSVDLLNTILEAVEAGFLKYSTVGLDLSDFPGIMGTIDYKQAGQALWSVKEYTAEDAFNDGDPTAFYDAGTDTYYWERTQERAFLFDVKITTQGGETDDYFFKIWGTLDRGRIVPHEGDWVIFGDDVPGPEIPEPSTIALMGLGLLGVGIAARRKMRK